jgi:hypothetical protein
MISLCTCCAEVQCFEDFCCLPTLVCCACSSYIPVLSANCCYSEDICPTPKWHTGSAVVPICSRYQGSKEPRYHHSTALSGVERPVMARSQGNTRRISRRACSSPFRTRRLSPTRSPWLQQHRCRQERHGHAPHRRQQLQRKE